MRNRGRRLGFLGILMGVGLVLSFSFSTEQGVASRGTFSQIVSERGDSESRVSPTVEAKVNESYGKLPLYFIQNEGQLDGRVKYYEKGEGHTTFFTREGVYLTLTKKQKKEDRSELSESGRFWGVKGRRERGSARDGVAETRTIKLVPLGADPIFQIMSEGLQEGRVNLFIGDDPGKWKTSISTYKAVVYRGVYPGVDMKFYGNNRQLEYDIIVNPGADPSVARLSYEGIKGLRVTEEGDLEITLDDGGLSRGERVERIIQRKPLVYQEIGDRRVEVDGRFLVSSLGKGDKGGFSYAFQIASYNKGYPLIIDPVIIYSTYLGGSGDDGGYGIAVDTSGSAYVTGYTYSTNFPVASPIQGASGGNDETFVMKLNPAGNALVYSTYLGGSGNDVGYGIAVDASGSAYVTGYTTSTNFPTASPIQGASGGGGFDAFVTKLNPAGSALVYSTYLGGSAMDIGHGIAVDASGSAYVTGYTYSTNFPTASPIQGANGGDNDAFVTKLNPAGSALTYSTYLGGSDYDDGRGIAVDTSGSAYVTGYTYSTNFPTASPIQGAYASGGDAFVTKLNPAGSALTYSTYLGGSGYDIGRSMAVDISGSAYVAGWTTSTNFPIASPIQGANGGGNDAFVTKLNPAGNALVYSTYLGGSGDDYARFSIAVDTSGSAYVTGQTSSTNFPVVNPIQAANAGGAWDAFVTKINPAGNALVYSTYLGGSGDDVGLSIAVDTLGSAYVTGGTTSTSFPTAGPIQGANGGVEDVFITKIGDVAAAPVPTITEWGTIILTILLGTGSVYYLRRRGLAL